MVQISACPALRREHFLADRIVNYAGHHFAGLRQAKRHVEYREAMGEVGGSIQGIDKPAILGGAFVPAALFRHDAVRGEMRAQALHHQFLRGPIGFRHQVELALKLKGDAAFKIVRQKRAGLARNLHSRFQIGQR